MLSMVFLKMAADLAFYGTFAGPFALHFGASGTLMLTTLAIVSLCVTLSYLLEQKGLLRFLPLLGCFACAFLPGAGLADRIVMLPPVAYAWMVGILRLYRPEWARQVEIFNVFWKVFLAYVTFSLLLRVSSAGVQLEVTMGMVMLVCSVLLMRSLRHEERVYRQVKYQLLNLGLVAAALAVAGLLSSKGFLNSVFAVLGAVYQAVAGVLVRLLMVVLEAVAFLFSWIQFKRNNEAEELQLNLGGAKEIFGLEGNPEPQGKGVYYTLIVLGIAAVALVIVLVFRFLAKRYGTESSRGDARDTRVYLDPGDEPDEKTPRGSAVQKVRAQYKRFLRLCLKRGRELKRSDTSLEVNQRIGHIFGSDAEELREIYLHARYDHRADKNDVNRAKELLSQLKKTADD